MTSLKTLFYAAALAAALTASKPALADDTDVGAIRNLMMAQFDRPESRLSVEPVTVYKGVAVASWSQGETGGRALLRRTNDKWVLTLCSGDALKEAKALQHFGLSDEEAESMAAAVAEAEAKLDPARVAKFSTFDGVVMMDDEGNHPPAGEHGGDHKG